MKKSALFQVLALVVCLPFGAGCVVEPGEEQAPDQQQLGASPAADEVWLSTQVSFGFCGGECITTVSREGAALEFTACTHEKTCPRTNRATLTAEGSRRLAEVEGALRGVALQKTYGCPDCADGGATAVRLHRDGKQSSHVYDFGGPPAPLSDLNKLTMELRNNLNTCTPGPLVKLEPGCVAR